jgi:hypothetical protein
VLFIRPVSRLRLALLALAACLIFYALGVPSLWLDEAASPLNARYPVEYIVRLSRTLEEHPPLFYLLLKAFLTLGHDDFTIRLLPALAGLGCVGMLAAVGTRLFSSPAVGTLAAACWLAMPQNLLLSRMARPYSLWLLFFLCALFFLADWLRRGRLTAIGGMLAASALMVGCHYLSFPLLAALGLCLLLAAPDNRPGWPPRLTAALAYGAGCLAITAAAYFGLIAASHTPGLIAGADETLFDAARSLGTAMAEVLYSFDVPAVRLLLALAVVLAFATLARRDRRNFLILATLTAVPPLLLLTLGRGTGLYARHLSSLAIPMALALAGGLAAVPRLAPRLGAVTLAVMALAAVLPLAVHPDRFYAVNSYQVPVIGNNYKLAAAGLAALDRPGTVLSFGNAFYGNAVSWYLNQTTPPLAAAQPRLTPEDPVVRLLFAAGSHWGYLASDAKAFVARYGPDVTAHAIETSTVLEMTVPREPVRHIEALPYRYGLPMDYHRVFAQANAATGLRHFQNARGPGLVAAHNDTDAELRLVFANAARPGPQEIRLNIQYDNIGQDNRLAARVRFDDEPPQFYPLTSGYDATHQRQIPIKRDTPYAAMTVDLVLHCASRTPTLSGGNLETLRLTGVEAFFCPAGEATACLDAAERHLTASMLDNYLEERFTAPQESTQATLFHTKENLVPLADNDYVPWTALTLADPTRPGLLGLRLTANRDRLLLFPRVGRDSTVLVFGSRPDGTRQLLFALQNASDRWTPISARYELVVPPWLQGREAAVEIELSGPWAQLWTLGDAVLF